MCYIPNDDRTGFRSHSVTVARFVLQMEPSFICMGDVALVLGDVARI